MKKVIALYALLICLLLSPISHASLVFINELHYDNTGRDQNEFVELASFNAVDLTNWSLIFYNGSNGSAYNQLDLSGALHGSNDQLGISSFLVPGLQNGAPDGVALINHLQQVVQFLSYEGSFVATNGAAQGHASKDIGVSQPTSNPVGTSLQLTGLGSHMSDFVWQLAPETRGSINQGQRITRVNNATAIPAPATDWLFAFAILACLVMYVTNHRKALA